MSARFREMLKGLRQPIVHYRGGWCEKHLQCLLLYSVQCPFTVQCTVPFYSTVYSALLQYRALFWLDSELLQGVALAAAPPVETIKFVN